MKTFGKAKLQDDTVIRLLFFLLFYCGVFLSCTERKGEIPIIEIQKNFVSQAGLSSVVDTIFAISLETTDDCLLRPGFILQRDDSLLFIEDNGIIYLFDIEGKFHKQLTYNGNGPGETRVLGYALNKDKKELIVTGQGRKKVRYKYDGTLISEKTLEEFSFSFRQFMIYNHSFWTVGTKIAGNESWILRFNQDWELQDSILLFRPEMPKEVISFYPFQSFSLIDNSLYVHHPSSNTDYFIRDTLYRIDKNRIIPELRVNYGDYTYRSAQTININKSGYPILLSQIKMNKRFLITRYLMDKEHGPPDKYYICYDFVTGKKYNLKDGFDDDIFHTGKINPSPLDIYHKEFYCTKSSEDVSELFPGRNETDNPVVLIMRLKE